MVVLSLFTLTTNLSLILSAPPNHCHKCPLLACNAGLSLCTRKCRCPQPASNFGLSQCCAYSWRHDGDLEREGKSCLTCQVNRNNPPQVPVHPWKWPAKPWSRLHVDYEGPFMGKMFLLIVDAHTKWMDIHITNSSTSQVTIEKLCQSFSNFGLPLMIVTDNGSSFVSEEFQTFLAANGIIHGQSSPYHPATNGLAERAVQTFKHSMRKLSGPLDSRLSQFLFRYRITPHTSTKISLAEAMFGRPLRSRLDLVYPDTRRRVQTQPPRFQSEVQDISAR